MAYNKSVRLHSFLCGALAVVLPALFVLSLMANTVSREQLDELLGQGPARSISILTVRPQTDGGVFCHAAIPERVFNASSVSGRRHVFMGLDTRRCTSCVYDPFWSFLLPPVFLSQVFCRVSVPQHRRR